MEEQSFMGIYIIAGSGFLTESLTYLKEQLPDNIRVVTSRDEMLCKLAGDADKVAAVRVLSPELLQVTVDDAFKHAWWVR